MPIHPLARRLPLLLALAMPFLTSWLLVGTYVLPARLRPVVVDLGGTWKIQEGERGGEAELARDDSDWKEIRFPGGFTAQGYRASRAWVRKRFELPPALSGRPLLLTLGGIRGHATLFLNGQEVGESDESFGGLKGEVDGLEAWTVDRRELRPGVNVLAIRFDWTVPGHDGVSDARLFLGAREQLLPYYVRASDLRRFVHSGALLLFVFMLLLSGTLLSRETDPQRRALQRATVFMMAASAFYLAIRIGVVPALTQSSPFTFLVRVVALMVYAWALLEFCLQYCLGRINRPGRIHRVICGASVGGAIAVFSLGPPAWIFKLYQLFTLYLFGMILYGLVITATFLRRRRRLADLVFASSMLCVIVAGVVDLLTDLDVWHAPRLLSVALINQGLCAGVLLIADFIQLSHVNETLSSRLTRTNEELAAALARAEDTSQIKSAMLTDRLVSVGTLASGVAHEINNPMAFVTANLTFLSRHLSELARSVKSDDPARGDLAELEQVAAESLEGARRVNQIVRELKLFARGGGDERPEAVDVRAVVRRSLGLALHVLESRARIVEELGEVPPVLGSESRLGQVCLNLLLNAGEAMAGGDPFRDELLVRTYPREDGRVVLEISDTGRGISAEEQRQLFDPFFTTKATGEGKGLGLSICHGIVQRLGGEIQVESQVGRGSLFRVVLPPYSGA